MDAFINTLTNIADWFLSIPVEAWGILLGAAGVSAITQVVKKVFTVENEKVIMVVFGAISFAATGLEYILSRTDLPPSILGVNTLLIIGAATPLYRFVIKPASNLITFIRQYGPEINARMKQAEVVNAAASLPDAKVIEQGQETKIVATVPTVDPTPEEKPRVVDF